MFKILLTTHGDLCRGMLETAKIFTENVENITAIPFYTQEDGYNAESEFQKYIQEICVDDVVIILTDILWGSVNQKVYLKLNEAKNIHIVTGLNLPLLLEIITLNPEDITQELISEKVNSCRDSIIYMREYVIKNNDDDE